MNGIIGEIDLALSGYSHGLPVNDRFPQHKIGVPEIVLNRCRITGRPLRCEIREFPPQRVRDVQDGQDFCQQGITVIMTISGREFRVSRSAWARSREFPRAVRLPSGRRRR